MRKLTIIAYDIQQNKVRKRVFNMLAEWAFNSQKSVHEAHVSTRAATELYVEICEMLNPDTDSLMMFTTNNDRQIKRYGTGLSDAAKTGK